MKRALIAVLVVIAFSTFAENSETATMVNATLKDGSTVKGEFCSKCITGSTLFMDRLDLAPAVVRSLAFSGTNGESKVELSNGDRFAMTVANESFAIKSMLGDLSIPRSSFRSIAFFSRKPVAGGTENGLVFYCTFDDEASLASPIVGPAVQLELGKIIHHEGKSGGALFVNPGIAGAEIKFPAGAFGHEGCIEFWANMASGKTEFSTGGDPRFFILLDNNGAEKAHFEFASNNGVGGSGLGGHFFGIRTQTHAGYTFMMPYSAVFKGNDYNGWHHYAFTWTATSLTIFVDGKEACRSHGTSDTKEIDHSEITMSIPLNRRTGKSFNNKSAFFMDELKIWNFAKTEFDL